MINRINIMRLRCADIYLWPARRLLLLALVLLAGLSYCLYANYTYLQSRKLAKLQNAEIQLKSSLEYKYRLFKSVALYQQKNLELDRLANQIKERLPLTADLPNVLLQINQLAEDSNVTIASFTPKDITPMKLIAMAPNGGRIMAETFVLNGVSSYTDLITFIYRIAQLSGGVEITNLQLIRVDDEWINLHFNLVIFYSSE